MPARPAQEGMMPVTAAATAKEIPYDYVAKFALQGRRGNRVQDVINISTEGAFVAVAIGYSFIPPRFPTLPSLPVDVGSDGSAVDSLALWVLEILQFPGFALPDNSQPLPGMLLQCHLVRLCGIDFKYSIVDSGTGRELQNQPIHNIAGLGEATGDRPFRPLAKPMLFMPRSTIRVEIEEISEGPIYGYDDSTTRQRVGAELFIVLHGYKMLGYGTALP
jgi:hypothetical protein